MRTLLVLATLSAALAATHEASILLNSPAIQVRQSCQGPVAGKPEKWWRAQISHNGTTPYAADSTFQYYRTATQYGADSSGKKDSSDAFNEAISGK